jgi:hypothetical protein
MPRAGVGARGARKRARYSRPDGCQGCEKAGEIQQAGWVPGVRESGRDTAGEEAGARGGGEYAKGEDATGYRMISASSFLLFRRKARNIFDIPVIMRAAAVHTTIVKNSNAG